MTAGRLLLILWALIAVFPVAVVVYFRARRVDEYEQVESNAFHVMTNALRCEGGRTLR